jgi:hypothetical protein
VSVPEETKAKPIKHTTKSDENLVLTKTVKAQESSTKIMSIGRKSKSRLYTSLKGDNETITSDSSSMKSDDVDWRLGDYI